MAVSQRKEVESQFLLITEKLRWRSELHMKLKLMWIGFVRQALVYGKTQMSKYSAIYKDSGDICKKVGLPHCVIEPRLKSTCFSYVDEL